MASVTAPLYVVEIEDQREPALAGHDGTTYQSPAQPAAQALTLARLILDRGDDQLTVEQRRFEHARAGGKLIVHIHPADEARS